MKYNTVTDINALIKEILETDESLRLIHLEGEISNLKYHSRGHIYFSLKDETSKINAVIWAGNNKLLFTPKDGDKVLVTGKINVFPGSGSYQIVVLDMKQDGVGNLYVLFEELKQKLSKEGLFDISHKRKIPRFPQRVGVITAREGAAVRDIISTINRRYPLCEIYLFPSLVQGDTAKDSIVKMINKANEIDLDVLIVGRGGGSIEDLWAFNEEIVARAIYNSKIPIVSAVGHEIDYTIADFVADLRAPTPTAAAELVVKNIEDIESYLSDAINRMDSSLVKKINHSKDILNKYKTNYILNNPHNIIEIKQKELSIYKEKINNLIQNRIKESINIINQYKTNYILNNPNLIYKTKKEKYEKIKLQLELLNPKNILEKGYSIVKLNGNICKDSSMISVKDNLNIILGKGSVDAVVKGVNNEK